MSFADSTPERQAPTRFCSKSYFAFASRVVDSNEKTGPFGPVFKRQHQLIFTQVRQDIPKNVHALL